MLTDEVATAFGETKMKIAHLTLALVLTATATACTAERALSPQPGRPALASAATTGMTQIPLLYVVDGVRLGRDQIPTLSSEQISAVKVLKGHAALEQYGPDASYGVVVITTKSASPRG
jgi:outer membrane receptor protein involved in Fe transport